MGRRSRRRAQRHASAGRAGFAARFADRDGPARQSVHHPLGRQQVVLSRNRPVERVGPAGRGGMTTLGALAVGARACVESIAGDDEISLRLMEMGLVPGTELRVVGLAPLGDPLELELRGYRLSLRRSEAERVGVKMANEQ